VTLEANVLRPDALRAIREGYEVGIRLAWYRSLPLSCVEGVSVTVDGRAPEPGDLRLRHGGRELCLDDLADRVDDWWFVQDPLPVVVPHPDPKRPGSTAHVEVVLVLRIPCIVVGPNTALVRPTHVEREVIVR